MKDYTLFSTDIVITKLKELLSVSEFKTCYKRVSQSLEMLDLCYGGLLVFIHCQSLPGVFVNVFMDFEDTRRVILVLNLEKNIVTVKR